MASPFHILPVCATFLTAFAGSASAQSIRLESILPSATDPAITSWNSAHIAALDTLADPRTELFLYLHGQGGTPGTALDLIKAAAELGYHAIGITYPNDWSPFNLCSGGADPNCPENVRREILEGVDHSPLIAISRTNSLENRLIKLLSHLDAIHPGEGWSRYLDGNDNIRWNRVAVWGHSQGGGNAAVLARHKVLARVCLSAPAADGGASSPAPWWAEHQTPSAAYFGFSHTQDALSNKVAFWNALGLADFGELVDIATSAPPFAGTHKLSTSIAPAVANQFHNSVIADTLTPRLPDGTPRYKVVWQHMLSAQTDSTPSQAPSMDDVVFATAPTFTGATELMLDVRGARSGAGPRPVLVWIHGGGWSSGSHNQFPSFANDLRNQGITVISIAYRLSGQANFPAQIHDCKAAIRWIRANATQLNIDPARIATWGSSAGGHLACLLATSGNAPDLEGDVGGNLDFSSAVVAAGVYFGPSDLIQMQPDCALQLVGCTINHDSPDSPESRLIGINHPGGGFAWLRANINNPTPPFPELVALAISANPISHLDSADPPMFIAHGDQDTSVPLHQSARVRDAAIAAGVPVIYDVAPGFGHGFLGDRVNARAVAWIAGQLLNANACPDCPADFDSNGGIDGGDLGAFINDFEAGLECADVDGNGGVDGGDLAIFFRFFEAGGC